MSKFEELYNRLPQELRDQLENCEQHPIYHKEGNVDKHIKLVFEYAEENFPEDKEILLSALFHDLGKPETKTIRFKNGIRKVCNYGHEFISKKYIDKYFHLFEDVSTNKEKVEEICLNHMKAALYRAGKIKKTHKIKDFENLKHFDAIIKFNDCDVAGKKE